MSTGSTRAICQSERMKNAPLSSIRNIIAYSCLFLLFIG